jgi:hypothetical protein
LTADALPLHKVVAFFFPFPVAIIIVKLIAPTERRYRAHFTCQKFKMSK